MDSTIRHGHSVWYGNIGIVTVETVQGPKHYIGSVPWGIFGEDEKEDERFIAVHGARFRSVIDTSGDAP